MNRQQEPQVLKLAAKYMASRPSHFAAEACFSVPAGVLSSTEKRCRLVFVPPGVVRVYVEATGELLAESRPGDLTFPAHIS